jgi:hypothetical protein
MTPRKGFVYSFGLGYVAVVYFTSRRTTLEWKYSLSNTNAMKKTRAGTPTSYGQDEASPI